MVRFFSVVGTKNATMPYCMTCGVLLQDGTQCSCEQLIVHNHVLAYCQAFLQINSVNVVARAVATYFTENDMIDARKLLKDKFNTKLVGLEISKYESRRTTADRRSTVMYAQDLTEAVYKLMEGDENIQFVTFDLRKLPLLQADTTDDRSIGERLLYLEKKLIRMEDTNDELHKQHDSRISKTEQELHKMKDDGKSYRHMHTDNVTLNTNVRPNTPNDPAIPSTSAWKTPLQLNTNNAFRSTQPAVRSAVEGQSDSSQVGTNTGDWQIPREHRRREIRNNSQPVKRNQNKRIQGTASGTGVKAGPGPNRDIWVCNVDKEVSDEDMKRFIEEGGSEKVGRVTVRLWEPRYKPEWDSKRFRLTIPLCDYEKVFTAEFWPENVWIKKYWVDFKKEREQPVKEDKAGSEAATENE